jgi:hypothetical protein
VLGYIYTLKITFGLKAYEDLIYTCDLAGKVFRRHCNGGRAEKEAKRRKKPVSLSLSALCVYIYD